MLVQTILVPNALSDLPKGAICEKLSCNILLRLLHDLLDNGIILYPDAQINDRAYLDAVASWPIKFRPRVQEIIRKLKLRNRLVASGLPATVSMKCSNAVSKPFFELGVSQAAPKMIVSEECDGCSTDPRLFGREVRAFDYLMSDFNKDRNVRRSQILTDGQWTQEDFERHILEPLFTYAKHVKIYDRYIGRSVLDARTGSITIKPEYENSLSWIIDTFVRTGASARGGVFEIYCGFKPHRISQRQRCDIRRAISAFQARLRTSYSLPITIILKKESASRELSHGRYLVTDQASILIERGFELLWDDKKMLANRLVPGTHPRPIKDTAIMLCADCSNVESSSQSLPNF